MVPPIPVRLFRPASFLSVAVSAVPLVAAQGPTALPSAGTTIELHSAILDEPRTLWIWTPPGMGAGPAVRYPVVYLMDADVHFRHVTALSEFLALYLRAPDMIVVGIVHPDRSRDLVPSNDRFLRFLVEEVRPRVDDAFPTAPYSLLVGHSLGGLFATHTLVHSPEAFDAYVALSPSLYWEDTAVVHGARTELARADRPQARLFLGMSEREPPGITTSTRAFATVLEEQVPPSLTWTLQEIGGENHITVPYLAVHGAYRWLFAGWPPSGVTARIAEDGNISAFDQHFAELSEAYGYTVLPTELMFSMLGDRLYRSEDWTNAIELFRRRVEIYPTSPEAHHELARGYGAAGNRELALRSYRRALELATSQRHPSLEAIRERLEAMSAGP